MIKRVRGLLPLVLAAGFGAFAPTDAEATITVTVKINGTQVDQFTDVGTNGAGDASKFYSSLSFGGTTFSSLTISASDNLPGDSTSGDLSQNSVTTKTSSGTGILEIDVVENLPFTSPGFAGLPMLLTSTLSRSSGTTAFTFQSFVTDVTNTVRSPGLQTAANVANTEDMKTLVFNRGAGYKLNSVLTVQAGGKLNDTGSTSVTALPEPSSLAMAAFGLPLLGLGAWARRRITRTA